MTITGDLLIKVTVMGAILLKRDGCEVALFSDHYVVTVMGDLLIKSDGDGGPSDQSDGDGSNLNKK